jgi:outer membrane receptor protein involved in Fe transport
MKNKQGLPKRALEAFAIISIACIPYVASAQSFDDLEELDLISVTGTRLTGATVEGSLPVSVYSESDLSLSPAATAADFLRRLPITGGASTQSTNFTNGSDGAARVGLRNIYGGNTLILFNGRRLQSTGTGGTADLNQIPMNAIKSVEILKAGGSTVYGTSAVAGVINFIMNDTFEGMEVNVGYANTFKTDVHELTADVMVGGQGAGGKFSFVVSANYRKQASMLAVDRPYMMGGGHSILPNPGLFFFGDAISDEIRAASGIAADVNPGNLWTLKNGVNVAGSPADFKPFVNSAPEDGGDRFPFENYTISINPNEQHGFFAAADYKLSDTLTFFTELGYAYSDLTFQLAAAPTFTFRVNPDNYFYNEVFSAAAIGADAAVQANGPTAYYRFVELGPRFSEYERRNVRMVAGFKADLPNDWNFETYAMYTQEKMIVRELNGGSERQVNDMLALSTPSAYNLFAASWIRGDEVGGGMENPARPNAALADQIRADNSREYESKTKLFDIRVANPNVFDAPAGPVQVVLGAEWRKENAFDKPDSLKLSGSLGWNAASGTTIGEREVYGLYGELQVPIIKNLEVSLAGRYEDYQGEFSTDVFGFNVRYQPISDLTLRASFSQAFIAPEVIDVFNPGLSGFPELNDPFYPATDPLRLYQVQTFYVGSAFTGTALKPETAEIYNVGFTYSPSRIENLDITVDYLYINKKDLIVYSVQGLLTEFRQSYAGGDDGSQTHPPANNPFLTENGGPIEYDANSATPVRGIQNAGPRNVAGEKLHGLDVDIRYRLDLETAGSLSFRWESTYYFEQKQQSATTGNWGSYVGTFDGDVAYPRFLAALTTEYSFGDLTAGLVWRHTGRTRDNNVNNDSTSANYDPDAKFHVERHNEFDIIVQYRLPFFRTGLRETTLTAGIQNVLNEKPPIMNTAFSNNYPERNYDPRGAYYFIRLKQTF